MSQLIMLKFLLLLLLLNPLASARPLAGGYSAANATSPEIISASKNALKIMNKNFTAYDKQLNLTGQLLLKSIVSAKSQVCLPTGNSL
jgi:hypothetical protein